MSEGVFFPKGFGTFFLKCERKVEKTENLNGGFVGQLHERILASLEEKKDYNLLYPIGKKALNLVVLCLFLSFSMVKKYIVSFSYQ